MRKFIPLLLLVFSTSIAVAQQFPGSVSIGTSSPANSKALLDLVGVTKVFLPPRMTTTQEGAISSPPEGGMVYDKTLHGVAVFDGTAWQQMFDAGNLTGSVPPGTVPLATTSVAGVVFAKGATTHQFLTSVGTGTGSFSSAQPAFTDISGTASAAQIPNPSASSLGGIESYSAVSHQWINSISTLGVPSSSQPNFSDLLGNVNLATQQTGTLPIANGGTGQVTATAAFNALSPCTSGAGILTYGSSTNSCLQATIGTTGQPLVSQGSISAPQFGVVGVAGGGTGYSSITSGTVMVGAGTTSPTLVAAGTAGNHLQSNGSTWISADGFTLTNINAANILVGTLPGGRMPAHTGDATSTAGSVALTVVKLQGIAVSSTSPTSTQVLTFNGTSSQWDAEASAGGGSGSGSGAYEFFTNGNAEINSTSGWSVYAGENPYVDGNTTIGSTHVTLTNQTGTIVRGTRSFDFKKDAVNRIGEGATFLIAADSIESNISVPIYFTFDYQSSANYASSDIQLYVYDVTNGKIITVLDTNGLNGALPANATNGRFTGWFYSNAGSKSYRLSWHVNTTNANAWDVYLDTIHAGGANIVPGAIVTKPASCTMTGGWSTNTTYSCAESRIGKWALYDVAVSLSGAPTGTLTINMPSGRTIDSSVGSWAGTVTSVGDGNINKSGSQDYPVKVIYTNSTTLTLNVFATQSGTNPVNVNSGSAVTATVPVTFASADSVHFRFMVPIVEWDVGAAMMGSDAALQNPPPITTVSSVKTQSATTEYMAMTNGTVTLTAGTWDITGDCYFNNNGTSPGYTDTYCGWFSATGADSASVPAALSSTVTVLTSTADIATRNQGASSIQNLVAVPLRVKCTSSSCVVALVPFASETTPANTRVSVSINANKVPDFTIFSILGGMGNNGGMYAFASSGTFTTPASSSTSTVYRYMVLGAGGGAGGSNNAGGASGGGGAGGWSKGTFTGVQPNTAITITVGTAGTAGGSTGTNGGTGGTSSIGSPVSVSATGGVGGTGETTATNAAGGTGGSGSGGNVENQSGASGNRALTVAIGGQGAGSMFGSGGIPGVANAGAGSAGVVPGSGGGGSNGVTAPGGAGATGLVEIWVETP